MNSRDKTVNAACGDIYQIVNIEISKAKLVKEDGVAMYEAGAALQRNAKPLLEQLEGLLGAESMEYKLLVDKCAKTVLQCGIDSFNTLQNKIEDGEAERFKEYAPKIKSLLNGASASWFSIWLWAGNAGVKTSSPSSLLPLK